MRQKTDVDGSETLSAVTLSNIPDGAILIVDGEEVTVSDGSADIAVADLNNVVLRVEEGTADFDLSASVTSTEPNGDSETSETSLTVNVPEANEGPVASDDTVDTTEDNSVTIDLTDNDSDVDGDSLSVTQIDGTDVEIGDTVDVGNGTVTLNEDGSVEFTPDGDYSGSESFDYTVSDGTDTADGNSNG